MTLENDINIRGGINPEVLQSIAQADNALNQLSSSIEQLRETQARLNRELGQIDNNSQEAEQLRNDIAAIDQVIERTLNSVRNLDTNLSRITQVDDPTTRARRGIEETRDETQRLDRELSDVEGLDQALRNTEDLRQRLEDDRQEAIRLGNDLEDVEGLDRAIRQAIRLERELSSAADSARQLRRETDRVSVPSCAGAGGGGAPGALSGLGDAAQEAGLFGLLSRFGGRGGRFGLLAAGAAFLGGTAIETGRRFLGGSRDRETQRTEDFVDVGIPEPVAIGVSREAQAQLGPVLAQRLADFIEEAGFEASRELREFRRPEAFQRLAETVRDRGAQISDEQIRQLVQTELGSDPLTNARNITQAYADLLAQGVRPEDVDILFDEARISQVSERLTRTYRGRIGGLLQTLEEGIAIQEQTTQQDIEAFRQRERARGALGARVEEIQAGVARPAEDIITRGIERVVDVPTAPNITINQENTFNERSDPTQTLDDINESTRNAVEAAIGSRRR